MKRLITTLFICILITTSQCVEAQGQFSETLTKLENSLLGLDYKNQTDIQRLNRLEETVYGSTSKSSIQQRVSKLSADMSADLIGKEIKAKKDTFDEEDSSYDEPIPKEDSSVSYPMVDALERTTFKQEFKGLDVKQRLSQLEQKIFKKAYSDDLNTRVERLKTAVLPKNNNLNRSEYEDSDYEYFNDDNSNETSSKFDSDLITQNAPLNHPDYNQNKSVLDPYENNADLTVGLAALEKKILRRSYPNDPVQARLVRLEGKVFKSTFTEDDEQTRIDRIASAYQAQKTSGRYDNNKFSQKMATAMQVGAFLLMILAAVL